LEGELVFKDKTLIMGVINVSPDSFYEGSTVHGAASAVERALLFEELGADIIDVGGESTRPGSKGIGAEEEKRRVLPVLEGIRKRSRVTLSVDTYKPKVAAEAIDCGAAIVNDISGLTFKNGLEEVVATAGVYIVLMHIRGRPATMQQHTTYGDVTQEVSNEIDLSIEKAIQAGIKKDRIIIDPGIGFAKTAEQNLTILKHLAMFRQKGYPILVGLSRKSFLGAYTGLEPENRLIPTIAANTIAIFLGADIIRVHDVQEAAETVKIVDAIKQS
jgi:dihydropteroate synthase